MAKRSFDITMNLSKISTAISILFPPTFVLFMNFYGFEPVAFAYAIFMFLYLILALFLKHDLKSVSTPLIYFAFVVIAYLLSSMEFIKLIPALISATFFLLFFKAFIQKKGLILQLAKKFYKNLGEEEEKRIQNSDAYWALVTLLNTLIQLGLVFHDDNDLWAFYSSFGWYIFMFIAIIVQIAYGKIRNMA